MPAPARIAPVKAFLLAAGHGTRLKPLTDTTPKCLLPIRGVRLLGLWLELCRSNGIDEVLVNTHAHADAVRTFLHAHSDGLEIHITEEERLLGSAGTLRANRDWVGSEDCFWVFYADVLTNMELGLMLNFHRGRNQVATLGVYEVPDPHRCGIIRVDGNRIICEFIEKPANPPSNLAFSGILLATPSLLDAIPPIIPADLGLDVFPKLAGKVSAYSTDDYLIDIGTRENYELAQRTWPGLPAAKS